MRFLVLWGVLSTFDVVWKSFWSRWQTFVLIGLGPVVLGVGVAVLAFVVFVLSIGSTLMAAALRGARGDLSVGPLFDFFPGYLFIPALFMIGVTLLVTAMSASGLAGAIAALRRGETVGFGTFWLIGWRNLWRTLGLLLLVALTLWGLCAVVGLPLAVLIVSALARQSSQAAVMLTVAGIVLAVGVLALLASFLMVNLAIYPTYLIAADGLGAGAAYARGWAIITRCFPQALQGWLVQVLFSLCTFVVVLVPVFGQLAGLALWALLYPFVFYYFSERYEVKLRPYFS